MQMQLLLASVLEEMRGALEAGVVGAAAVAGAQVTAGSSDAALAGTAAFVVVGQVFQVAARVESAAVEDVADVASGVDGTGAVPGEVGSVPSICRYGPGIPVAVPW